MSSFVHKVMAAVVMAVLFGAVVETAAAVAAALAAVVCVIGTLVATGSSSTPITKSPKARPFWLGPPFLTSLTLTPDVFLDVKLASSRP